MKTMTTRQFNKMKKDLLIAYQTAFQKWAAISDENSIEKQNAFTDLTIAWQDVELLTK